MKSYMQRVSHLRCSAVVRRKRMPCKDSVHYNLSQCAARRCAAQINWCCVIGIKSHSFPSRNIKSLPDNTVISIPNDLHAEACDPQLRICCSTRSNTEVCTNLCSRVKPRSVGAITLEIWCNCHRCRQLEVDNWRYRRRRVCIGAGCILGLWWYHPLYRYT